MTAQPNEHNNSMHVPTAVVCGMGEGIISLPSKCSATRAMHESPLTMPSPSSGCDIDLPPTSKRPGPLRSSVPHSSFGTLPAACFYPYVQNPTEQILERNFPHDLGHCAS